MQLLFPGRPRCRGGIQQQNKFNREVITFRSSLFCMRCVVS